MLFRSHTSDGFAWRHLDALHKDKSEDPRQPRVAISTDGFNVYGMTAAQYSCWPVFFIPLKLPPGEIMKRKNILPTLIIPGPNYPGKNMNVYMHPLKDELKEAWDNGINTYNAATIFFTKCMCGTCTRRMIIRRLRYSLASVCMEGSLAPQDRKSVV